QVFPARAGINRNQRIDADHLPRVPRVSGDKLWLSRIARQVGALCLPTLHMLLGQVGALRLPTLRKTGYVQRTRHATRTRQRLSLHHPAGVGFPAVAH
ncbi:hypothetical protein, partial [Salmonella sp. s51944]|uniref:hypothetical protein n=1 Tax=Salmonella sp. s51944 TaxID=3159655 RepID=UPI00397F7285